MLAVCLDHFECAQILLEAGAICENSVRTADGWAAVHEATCTGDVELLSLILQYRDSARSSLTRDLDTVILGRLREVPDFYVEMKWEFSSWIPFVSRLCPSDVCRIYKVNDFSWGVLNTAYIKRVRHWVCARSCWRHTCVLAVCALDPWELPNFQHF